MATISLKGKKPAAPARTESGEKRAPVRGKGVSKPRQTLAQAQAEREQRQAEYLQRQAQALERPPRQAREERDERSARPARPARPDAPKPYGRSPAKPSLGPRPQRQDRAPRSEPQARPDRPARPGPQEQAERAPAKPPRVDQRRSSNWGQVDFQNGQNGPQSHHGNQGPAGFRPPAPRRTPKAELNPEEGERLSKRMGELKLASRRESDEWIAAGWVRVNGRVAVLGQRVAPDAVIEIDPLARREQAQRVTILMHKPMGYVSGQAEDGYEPAAMLIRPESQWSEDASGIKPHPGYTRGLAPAGRLDIDSTGLLVLTQDGRVAKLLIGEDSAIEKEYLVRVEYLGRPGNPPPEGAEPMHALPAQDLALLRHGLELDGQALKPAQVSWQNEQQLRVVLREGKKRQIRRMCEQVGLKVVGLKRVRIGRINLGHLPVGQWRYLAPWEAF